jgi:hypothetical protein
MIRVGSLAEEALVQFTKDFYLIIELLPLRSPRQWIKTKSTNSLTRLFYSPNLTIGILSNSWVVGYQKL